MNTGKIVINFRYREQAERYFFNLDCRINELVPVGAKFDLNIAATKVTVEISHSAKYQHKEVFRFFAALLLTGECWKLGNERVNLEFTLKCVNCGSIHTVVINNKRGFVSWMYEDVFIQNAMPNLNVDNRELLISAICPKCFDNVGEE